MRHLFGIVGLVWLVPAMLGGSQYPLLGFVSREIAFAVGLQLLLVAVLLEHIDVAATRR